MLAFSWCGRVRELRLVGKTTRERKWREVVCCSGDGSALGSGRPWGLLFFSSFVSQSCNPFASLLPLTVAFVG